MAPGFRVLSQLKARLTFLQLLPRYVALSSFLFTIRLLRELEVDSEETANAWTSYRDKGCQLRAQRRRVNHFVPQQMRPKLVTTITLPRKGGRHQAIPRKDEEKT